MSVRHLPSRRDFILWCCLDLTKLAEGDIKGLLKPSRALFDSFVPAGRTINFLPIFPTGDAAIDDGADGFGVLSLPCSFDALKLNSLKAGLGKLGLS